jgi:hypothetical protein
MRSTSKLRLPSKNDTMSCFARTQLARLAPSAQAMVWFDPAVAGVGAFGYKPLARGIPGAAGVLPTLT